MERAEWDRLWGLVTRMSEEQADIARRVAQAEAECTAMASITGVIAARFASMASDPEAELERTLALVETVFGMHRKAVADDAVHGLLSAAQGTMLEEVRGHAEGAMGAIMALRLRRGGNPGG